jgi:hypothetical protein
MRFFYLPQNFIIIIIIISVAHTATCSVVTVGCFRGVKWPEREAPHSHQSGAESELSWNSWFCTIHKGM